jgi:H+/Cl- antiporter ClcA
VWSWFKGLVKRMLTRQTLKANEAVTRRVTLTEQTPSDRFVLVVALMIVFFAGLVGLEVTYMVWMSEWNEAIFNGIMLIVGTIVGTVWGKTSQ